MEKSNPTVSAQALEFSSLLEQLLKQFSSQCLLPDHDLSANFEYLELALVPAFQSLETPRSVSDYASESVSDNHVIHWCSEEEAV